jgi:hypothetical protein
MIGVARRAVFLPSLLALCACEGDRDRSPTGPPPDPAGNVIVFTDASLRAHEGTIRDLIESAIARAGAELPIQNVTINVRGDASRAIPGWGIGGRASGGTTVELSVDPAFPGLAGVLAARLPPLTAHELHHIVRTRGPGYGATLLEALVSEGLADQFSLELYGGPPPPWVEALDGAELEHWLDEAAEEFDSTAYDHDAWFFGNGTIPSWTGYTIGHRLVVGYQDAHPGESAADLVNTPAEAFRPN